jgi:hypothetical protein
MPEYHPNEHPGLLYQDIPIALGPRSELLVEKHASYIASFARVRFAGYSLSILQNIIRIGITILSSSP